MLPNTKDNACTTVNLTIHPDSIPRGKRANVAHQKALDSGNWHTKTMAAFKDKSNTSLTYIINDANAAVKANPTGPKAGQYMDEVHYANMELAARQKYFATKL